MTTLAAGIDSTQSIITVVSPGTPVGGNRFQVDDELVEFIGFGEGVVRRVGHHSEWDPDETVWRVTRGIEGTAKAPHAQGATLTQFVVTEIEGGGGGGLPTGWTQTDATHVDAGNGSITGVDVLKGFASLTLRAGNAIDVAEAGPAAIQIADGVPETEAGSINITGGTGSEGVQGGGTTVRGGDGDEGNVAPASIWFAPGGAADPGILYVTTNGVSFDWKQMPHLANGSSVDQLRDLLVAAGLMAAS